MEDPLVLIVDDDRTIQAIVAGVLSDARFGCRNASSGEEAISLLNADRCQALIGRWPGVLERLIRAYR
jgi:DNA-binding response OmpR family regulator